MLRVAAGDGRITAAELDERVGAALTARTYGELAALVSDIPAAPGSLPLVPDACLPRKGTPYRAAYRASSAHTTLRRWPVRSQPQRVLRAATTAKPRPHSSPESACRGSRSRGLWSHAS